MSKYSNGGYKLTFGEAMVREAKHMVFAAMVSIIITGTAFYFSDTTIKQLISTI